MRKKLDTASIVLICYGLFLAACLLAMPYLFPLTRLPIVR